MQLRDHPLMSHRSVPNWPPVWRWISGENYKQGAKGEVGILEELRPSLFSPYVLHIIMQHESCEYIGALIFDDLQFCRQMQTLLQEHCGQPIRQIGDIDLSHSR